MATETKTATHTPGPWRVENDRWIISDDYSPHDVAQVVRPVDSERRAANARLIAAAPDLLEALIGVHSFEFPTTRPDSLCWCPPKWHDYPAGQQPPHSAQCQEAKDAIAKATGAQA